jgi:hypothetical protein
MVNSVTIFWPMVAIAAFVSSFDLDYDVIGLSFLLGATQTAIILGVASRSRVSALSMYSLFTLIFLQMVPWLHYSESHVIWRSRVLDQTTLFNVNVLIFLANFVIVAAYIQAPKRSGIRYRDALEIKRPALTKVVLVSFSLIGFFGVLYINNFNLQLLFFRGLAGFERENVISSSSLALIIGMTARLLPGFAFYFAATELRNAVFIKIFLFIVLLVSVFPTGVPRFLVAFVYIPALLIIFPALRRGVVFGVSLLAGILFVFPFLEQFRFYSTNVSITFLPSADFFFAAHFDAYENFASAVELNFQTYGYQLIGVLLFFVPRTFWPEKPVGSGFELAEQSNYTWQNISMPFLGEGFVNFGLVGVFLFAAFLGYLMGKIDKSNIHRANSGPQISFRDANMFFYLGALFFVLRGDLLSSFAFFCAGLVTSFALEFCLRKIND